MPRKRTETVNESLATLAELKERYRDKPQEDRLAVLYLLKENPARTLEEVSAQIGCSERTVRRWWSAYKTGGLDGLLDVQSGGGGKPARIGDEDVAALAEKLRSEGITDVREVQSYLKEQLGLDYSLSGVRYLMRTKLKLEEGYEGNGSAVAEPADPLSFRNAPQPIGIGYGDAEIIVTQGLVDLLNSFPVTMNVKGWGEQFRGTLLRLLPDIDRVIVNIDVASDLSESAEVTARSNVVLRQSTKPDGDVLREVSESVDVALRGTSPAEGVIEYLRRQSFPFDQFQAPRHLDFYLKTGSYLGSVLLFREKHKGEISQHSLELLESLRPFITFMLSDAVARHQRARPMDIAFKGALQRMMAESGLSIQEQRVVFLQLLGCSYKESADLLRVSLNTIRHHLKSIHAKTNTRSQAELFAKYFTPLMAGSGVPDEGDI